MIERATATELNSDPIEGTTESLRRFSISLRKSTVVLCSLVRISFISNNVYYDVETKYNATPTSHLTNR
jgi:hypothetical protein